MRLLALFLLAGRLGAVCATGTFDFWTFDNTRTGACAGNVLASAGTGGTFATTPAPPGGYTYNIGSFSAANYMTGPAAWRTAWDAASATWTWQAYIYITAGNNGQMLRLDDGAKALAVQVLSSGSSPSDVVFGVFSGGWSYTTAPAVTWNEWHHIAITFNSGTRKIYIDNVEKDSDAGSATMGALTSIRVGSDGGTPFAGYMSAMRWSNIVETSFPTVDPVATGPQILSPYIKQGHSPFVTPMWWMP